MSDSTPITPPNSASLLPPASTGQQGQAQLLVSDAPVRQAPPGLRNPAQPIHIEGRVISSDPKDGELRIGTRGGEVTVRSSINLPPGTRVSVDLYMQRGQEVANVSVARAQAAISQELEQVAPAPTPTAPPPQLQPGDEAQAVVISDPQIPVTEEAPPQPQAAPTLQQLAVIIPQLDAGDLQKLPQPLPLAARLLIQIATASNPLIALQALRGAQQEELLAYAARPDVLQALQKALPPGKLSSLGIDAPATLPGADESNLLDIARAQADAKMAQEPATPQSGAAEASSPTGLSALKGLLPLLEALQTQGTTTGGLPPLMAQGLPPATGLLPQNLLFVKIVAVTPDGQTPPAMSATPQETPDGTLLQGKVDSISPQGFPVIRVDDDLFVLKTLATAPVGSTVTFTAAVMTPEDLMEAARPGASADTGWFQPLFSDSWPAMQEVLQNAAALPNAAATLHNTLPSASPRLVPAALFFLAALRMGDIESWLGENMMQSLKNSGRQQLADRLTADFTKIAEQAKETVAGDWRVISMPLRHDEQVSQLQFFVRQQRDEQQEKKDEPAVGGPPTTRFILNLRLSRMGDMQLDGLLHRKVFNLILRSADALPAAMRQDLAQAFTKGLEQAEMTGGVSFQTRTQSWVKIDLPAKGTTA